MTDLRLHTSLAAALGDYYTDPATRVPEMPPMHWGGAKVVFDTIAAEGGVVVSDATAESLADILMDLRMDGPAGEDWTYQQTMRHYAAAIVRHLREQPE